MEKVAFIFLLLVLGFSLVSHCDYERGYAKATSDFNSQMKNHKDFYEHNLKSECSQRGFKLVESGL